MALLGKLKALGDKLENVATNVARDVVSGVQTGVTTVGTGVITVAKDIKDSVLDGELDRIRSVHAFQRSQSVVHKRKELSEQEIDAADQRAAVVLDLLPLGYFEQNYDPVRHELSQLPDNSGQAEVDAIVERLGACVEAVSGKLARHVMKKRDQLLIGIDVVASVEDDLKAALSDAQHSRVTVRVAGEEVQRQMRVASQTRRKQAYIQTKDLVDKIKQAKDLQRQLRKAQECGEHREAILLCVECFKNVESLRELKVCAELIATVQRLYVDTLQKLDTALAAICGQFDATRYAKVLDAYLLQRMDGKALADKVLQSFKASIQDTTVRCVRALLLTQSQLLGKMPASTSSSIEGSFGAMCGALPVKLIVPALAQVCEVTVQTMASFYHMECWHKDFVATAQQEQAARIEAGQPPDEAMAASLELVTAVKDMLGTSRQEVFAAAVSRAIVLVKAPSAAAGSNLLQVGELCARLLSAGEAFCTSELPQQRDAVGAVLAHGFEAYHHANMQTLSALMQSENAWKNIGGHCLAHEIPEGSLLELESAMKHYRSSDGRPTTIGDFGTWLATYGKPFQISSLPTPGINLGVVTSSSAGNLSQQASSNGAANHSAASTPAQSLTQEHRSSSAATLAYATSAASQPPTPSSTVQPQPLPSQGFQQGHGLQLQASDKFQALLSHQPMLTPAARHMLGCIKAYCQLYRALGRQRAGTLWQATTQLFERFLTATFMLIGGISIEALVLQDDIVTVRLRRVLLRILTADGSRYKSHIEELQRSRGTVGRSSSQSGHSSGTGISWLDRFGDKMESLANDLDRSVSKLSAVITEKVPGGADGLPTSVQECVVAGESLAVVAGELRRGRNAILAALHAAAASVRQDRELRARQGQLISRPSSYQNLATAGMQGPGSPAGLGPPPSGFYPGHPGFTPPAAPQPPPVTPTVRLQYQGMQQVLAAGQQQLQQSGQLGSPHGNGLETGYQQGDGEFVRLPPMALTTENLGREADAYFKQVLTSAWDLREALLQGAARSLLGRLLDPERGIIAAVTSVVAYSGRDVPTQPNEWAKGLGKALKTFADNMQSRQDLPALVQNQIWLSALGLVSDSLTTAFSRVKRCTLEGRAAMSMDLSYVERVVYGLLPENIREAGVLVLKRTDAYVRALYLPWPELCRFCELHVAEYRMHRLLPLIDQAADVHRVKRQDKAKLLGDLEHLSSGMD